MSDTFLATATDRVSQPAALPADVAVTRYNPRGWANLIVLTLAKLVDDVWKSVPVSADDPIPTAARGYRSAVAIVPGTDQAAGRAVHVVATVAGDVKLKLADDSELVLAVEIGVTILPFEAQTVVIAGTTATATYLNLA